MKKTVLSVATAALLTTTLGAQEVKLPVIHIIEDSAASLNHIAGSTTIITQETLERTQPLSLQDALKKTAGIHAVETDGYGFYPRITIRGIGSDMSKKVLLLEDGAPIALGPYTDPAAYYHPPVERMQRIEVLKGSGSITEGPSNIGGVVNYITKQPRDGANIVMSAGNFNYQSLLAEYGVVLDDYSFSVSALKKSGDGWREMGFDATDVVVKGAMKINDNNTIGIKLTHYEHEAAHTYLGLTEREYEENYKQNKAVNDKMNVERNSVDLTHQYVANSGFSLKTLAYYNKSTRDWWRQNNSFNPVTGYNDMANNSDGRLRNFEVMGIDSRALFMFDTAGVEHEAEVGIKLHTETMKNKRVRATDQYNYIVDTSVNDANYYNGVREDDVRKANAITFFAQDTISFTEATSVTPGVRVEKYEQTRDINSMGGGVPTPTSTTTDNTEVIPGIGMTHKFAKEANFFAGVHKGFAPPRVADAISSSGVGMQLEAERSINYEIGLRGAFKNANYEVTYFRLDFENQIISQSESIGSGGTGQTNGGETLNQGIELSGDVAVTNNIFLSGNYTYLGTAEFTGSRFSGTTNVSGNRLTYAPEHLLNLSAIYDAKTWGAGVGYSYVSEQFSDVTNTTTGSADGKGGIIPSYNLWDLNAWYVINKHAKLNLAIKNLTDERYIASRAPGGINPGMGMNAQGSLKISF